MLKIHGLRNAISDLWLLFLLWGAGLLLLLPSLDIYFVSDNIGHITRAAENFANVGFRYFRPLPVLSLHADYLLWGADPRGYHLTNLILHLINVLLVYILAKVLWHNFSRWNETGIPIWQSGRGFAFIAALLFLLHPIHSLAIFWISGRTDMICAIFYITTCLLFIGYWRTGRRIWQGGALIAFLLALLSKEMAASLPLVLLGYAFIFPTTGDRGRIAAALQRTAPHWLLLVGYVLFRFGFVGRDLFGNADHRLVGPLQLVKNLAVYMGLLVVPGGHAAIGDVLKAHPLWFAVLAVGAVGLLLLSLRRLATSPPLIFLLLFVLLSLLPVIRLVMRWYLYIPSIGVCLMLAYGIGKLAARGMRGQWAAGGTFAALALIYGFFLWQAQWDWRQAGEVSRNYTAQLAAAVAAQPGTDFYVLNVPGEVAEVPVAMFGLQAFIRFRLAHEYGDHRPVILRRVAYLSLRAPADLTRQQVRKGAAGQYELTLTAPGGHYFFPDHAAAPARWQAGMQITAPDFQAEIRATNPQGQPVGVAVSLSDRQRPVLLYQNGQILTEIPPG